MTRQLHVGNLSFAVHSGHLQRLFAAHGKVLRAQVVSSPTTGRSTGVGLVEMQTDEQAANAMALLNNHEYCGHPLVVSWATARELNDAELAAAAEQLTAAAERSGAADDPQRAAATGPSPGGFGDRGGVRRGERSRFFVAGREERG
jgi:RNA recognition motif-containing protein